MEQPTRIAVLINNMEDEKNSLINRCLALYEEGYKANEIYSYLKSDSPTFGPSLFALVVERIEERQKDNKAANEKIRGEIQEMISSFMEKWSVSAEDAMGYYHIPNSMKQYFKDMLGKEASTFES